MSDDENDQTNTNPSYETSTKAFSNGFYEEHTYGYSFNDLAGDISEMASNIVETLITVYPELDTERKSALANEIIARSLRERRIPGDIFKLSVNESAFDLSVKKDEKENGQQEEQEIEKEEAK
ncbi:hypothetical protein L202_08092 [Cryptococcus amylolentus CBS 6039]|uniref:Uncharacterized protein n=2 Tax=Cryptococcus amylolentus TaxID=104669 RepID=A0A1E3HDT1_9TREE|nr:hypothetical protein L202_08092 [Cryptococcus amylolentus CBS 6039]ODN73591.1 hypothetical protein L202_08092 [Cryptococcus amylolentus CBS 6039]ODN99325.1 hypothetical protein I350_07493 [Cryptococcus amylolentus CBS 6273]